MGKRLETYLLDLPVPDKDDPYPDAWRPLTVSFTNNRETGKYNVCTLRIKSHTDASAFPMTVKLEMTDENVYDFTQEISAIDITIEGGWELNYLLKSFEQILEAEKVVNTMDKGG